MEGNIGSKSVLSQLCHSVTRLVVSVYIIKKVYQNHIVGGLQTNPYIVKSVLLFEPDITTYQLNIQLIIHKRQERMSHWSLLQLPLFLKLFGLCVT